MNESAPNKNANSASLHNDDARGQLGVWLRAARERSGLSIEAISQETRIGKNYIVSLEAGKLEALPGKVFGRGFVKNITRLLKTDAAEGLRLYDACWGTPAPVSVEDVSAEAQKIEVHKTKSVQARIAEPVNVTSEVTQRLMTGDFPAAGEKPRLPNTGVTKNLRANIKMPAWLVRGVVSPHTRLWVLGSIAGVFVCLIFGRWAAGHIHKSRLAAKSQQSVEAVIPVAENIVTNAENMAAQALPESERSDLASAKFETVATPDKAISNDIVARTAMPAKTIATDEDNPLYMASVPAAAFEQVLELKVLGSVEIRLILDGKKIDKSWFEAQTYRFTFNDRAEIYILDAGQVELQYNGKSLGQLGNKGRKRRIFFQAKASADDFPQ